MKLYIGTQPNPEDRFILDVSSKDAEKIHGPKPFFARVTDQTTGKKYWLRDADCGLGCRCALELATVDSLPREDLLTYLEIARRVVRQNWVAIELDLSDEEADRLSSQLEAVMEMGE